MQPTMKLRLFQPENGIPKGVPFITDSYGRCYVLQQLWEEKRRIEGGLGSCAYEVTGEWRDVPFEVE